MRAKLKRLTTLIVWYDVVCITQQIGPFHPSCPLNRIHHTLCPRRLPVALPCSPWICSSSSYPRSRLTHPLLHSAILPPLFDMDVLFNCPPKSRLSTLGEILARWFDEYNLKGSLQVLARTCKSFAEPMLVVIWRKLPNIGILFFSLPDGAWEVKAVNHYHLLVHRLVSHLSCLRFPFRPTKRYSCVAPPSTGDCGGCSANEILCFPRRGGRRWAARLPETSKNIPSPQRLHLLTVASLQHRGGLTHPSPTDYSPLLFYVFNPSTRAGATLPTLLSQLFDNTRSILLYPQLDHRGCRPRNPEAPRTSRYGRVS